MAKLSPLKLAHRAAQGVAMVVLDPFGVRTDDGELPPLLAADGTPATLTLLGADSPVARKLDYQRAAAAQNRVTASIYGRGKAKAVITPDDIMEQAAFDLERLVALTTDWHGFEDDDDHPIPFSPDAVRELYQENPLIREQAMAFLADRVRFFAPSSTPSAPSSRTSSASADAPATT